MFKPRTIASAVDKIARQTAGKDWGLYANLLNHWTEIVGGDYARTTTPIKITIPYQPQEATRKNGVLTVRLPKGLAMEFSFKSDLIRQRINSFFGYEAFARIALDAASLPVPEVKKQKQLTPDIIDAITRQTAVIENTDLRDALAEFGKAMRERSYTAST